MNGQNVFCGESGITGGESAHPSADESRVLQRPSGASILAATSMPIVAGSRVSRAAVTMPRPQPPEWSIADVSLVAVREEEHAVSIANEGPVIDKLTAVGENGLSVWIIMILGAASWQDTSAVHFMVQHASFASK